MSERVREVGAGFRVTLLLAWHAFFGHPERDVCIVTDNRGIKGSLFGWCKSCETTLILEDSQGHKGHGHYPTERPCEEERQ